MNIYLIKTILFACALIILCVSLFQIKFKRKEEKLFLLSSAFMTIAVILVLSIKLHHILRDEFGISNTITYLYVSIPIIMFFYRFRILILKSSYPYIFISVGFLGAAVTIDLLTDGKILILNNLNLTEEILRIIGSFFWMLYYLNFVLKLRNK